MENLRQNPNPETARAVEEYLVNLGKELGTQEALLVTKEINGLTYIRENGEWEVVKPVDARRLNPCTRFP